LTSRFADVRQTNKCGQYPTVNAEEFVDHDVQNAIAIDTRNTIKSEVSSQEESIRDSNNQSIIDASESDLTILTKQVAHPCNDDQESAPVILIKSENEDTQEANSPLFLHQPVLRRSPLCQTLKTSRPSHHRPTLKTRTLENILNHEPLPAHAHSKVVHSTSGIGENQTACFAASTQNEPLDLGKGNRNKVTVSPLSCSKPSRDQNASKNSRLLDLLMSSKGISKFEEAKAQSDPLEQLKNVLSNPKYMVPDPLLVPKCRLSALVTCPGEEIPRLLSQNAWRDLSFHSILSDPDVLVVSLSHLQSLLKKPINEDEILAYQKQTDEIRSCLREQCFNNNNNDNHVSSVAPNWNSYYWKPNYHQETLPAESSYYSSMSNLGLPSLPAVLENTPAISKLKSDYRTKSPGWHDLTALQQMSTAYHRINGTKDDDNNNIKDVYSMIWSQDLPYYKCCREVSIPNSTTLPKFNDSNSSQFHEHNKQNNQLAFPFLPSVTYSVPPPHELGNNAQHYDPLFSDFYPNVMNNSKTYHWEPFEPLYPLQHDAPAPVSENKSLKQTALSVEEKKPAVKEERENQPPVKEMKNESSNRPLVPKIKVRKHLVDPNQHPPKLLNQNTHIFRPYPFSKVY
jgi:hypothetical protein